MAKTKGSGIRRKRAVVRGGGIVSSAINKAIDLLPVELHLPGFRWCGPGTKVKKRLARGDKGINPLDEACKTHDIAYTKYSDNDNRSQADRKLADSAWKRFKAPDASLGEKTSALLVTAAMKAKTKFGGGKRKKTGRKTKETLQGKRLVPETVLKKRCRKKGEEKENEVKQISIPIKPLTNYELIKYAKDLKIPSFRGVYMRDTLPATPRKYESAIVNLDNVYGHGTHWVCYKKCNNSVHYYDSFGNLRPPPELLRYFKGCDVYYNYKREQTFDSVVCGHLCLKFLTRCFV